MRTGAPWASRGGAKAKVPKAAALPWTTVRRVGVIHAGLLVRKRMRVRNGGIVEVCCRARLHHGARRFDDACSKERDYPSPKKLAEARGQPDNLAHTQSGANDDPIPVDEHRFVPGQGAPVGVGRLDFGPLRRSGFGFVRRLRLRRSGAVKPGRRGGADQVGGQPAPGDAQQQAGAHGRKQLPQDRGAVARQCRRRATWSSGLGAPEWLGHLRHHGQLRSRQSGAGRAPDRDAAQGQFAGARPQA